MGKTLLNNQSHRDAEGESPANESLKALLGNVRDQLLQGLSDETEAIR